MSKDVERELRLEQIVRALTESNDTLEALKKIVSPFADNKSWVYGKGNSKDSWEWEEDHLFNEARLYQVLGKDDARSILGIWRRFREICELLMIVLPKEVK